MVDCPPLPEPVFVDRDMWEKVVLNLVSNAFKFTLEGEIVVRLGPVGGAVELSVRDTGTGIPAGELPRIFERFHRVDGARGRTHEGTGIGLALVQELVRLHGGSVRAESTLGRGSTFVVSVPLGNAHLPADSVGASRPPAATAVGAAAFVEEALRWLPDEEASRASPTARLGPEVVGPGPRLRGRGLAPSSDPLGRRQRGHARLRPPAPGTAVRRGGRAGRRGGPGRGPGEPAGPGALRRDDAATGRLRPPGALRADPRTSTIPVILLSARAGEESRVEGLEAGADDYLVKPFGARELLARVHAHLEMDRLRREASRREQALLEGTRAAKERLEAVLRSISDGFIALDRDWRYVSVNDRACESMGMRREEILGRRIWDLYPDTVGTRFEAELRRAAAGRETRVFEYYYPERDRWYENRAYPSEDGLSIFFAEITERRRAEAERERLALLVENSNDFIGICDLRGFPTFANPAALRMVGLDSLEQVRGSTIEAFFFPEDRAFVMDDLVPRIIREGQAKAEIRFRHFVTGEPIWMLFSAFAVSDASGELVALATVSRDVTEERRARLALAESEGRLAAELAVMKRLQELSTRLVKHGDEAGLLPEIVDAAIGITAADMGNIQLYDRASDSLRIVASRGFRPEDLELFAVIRRGESTCGTALERGERVVVGDVTASAIFAGKPILDAVLAAGIRALLSTPLISRSGRLVGMLSTHYRSPRSPAERDLRILDLLARQAADWIERTQAEAALRESEARFRNMADHAPVMIWVTDPTGACNYVNERWCDFTGTPPEESFDFGWLDSVHPDDREKAGSAFRSANARNEAFRVEYRLRRHDGAYRWVIDSAAPGSRRMAQYLGYIGSVLDVTDEKRAEEEIRRARDELDLRVRERTAALIGGARGPRAAGGGPQGAAPAGRDGPGRRAAEDLPRAARPDGPAAHGPDAPPAAGQGLGGRGLPPPGTAPVAGGPRRPDQPGRPSRGPGTAPHRARRPRPPGGAGALRRRVDAAVRGRRGAEGQRPRRGAAAAARRDDDLPGGPGGDDQRPEARRGDPRRRHPQPAEGFRLGHHRGRRQGLRRRGGDGIRLPGPARPARHEGAGGVRGGYTGDRVEPGGGDERPDPHPDPVLRGGAPMTRLRVLLAEDHAIVREGLRALLDAQPDMEVVGEAADGREALDAAKALGPDVVVMDISMPGLNGARATEAIRRDCPGTRVLALTMHEDKGYLRQLVQAGASGYLLKRAASQDLIHAPARGRGGRHLSRSGAGGRRPRGLRRQGRGPGFEAGGRAERARGGGGPADRAGLQQQGDRGPARPQLEDGGDLQGPVAGEARPLEPVGPGELRRAAGLAGRRYGFQQMSGAFQIPNPNPQRLCPESRIWNRQENLRHR